MAAHGAVAAVPAAGTPDRPLAQALLIERYGYVVKAAEDPADLDPRGEGGTLALVIGYAGKWFWLDPADATTAHDGVTCIVTTATGGRYKIEGVEYLVIDVADKDLAAPPGTPAIGERYIVGAAATGDWASHDDEIAVFTARGWEFIEPGQGRIAYVADEQIFYHFTAAGAWAAGLGATPLAADSVPFGAAIGFGAIAIVENQTTTAPPGSPSTGDAYIIGASATGAWTGHDGKVAICEDGATFTIYAPAQGFRAHDKALNRDLRWSGSAWVSAGGYFTIVKIEYTANDTYSKPADLIGVMVEVYGGGGGGSGSAAAGGAGAQSAFGSHCSATGGAGGPNSAAGGAGGAGTGGDINRDGERGWGHGAITDAATAPGGRAAGPHAGSGGGGLDTVASGFRPGAGGSSSKNAAARSGGGGGGYAGKWIDAADLAANEAVQVGAGGAGNGAGAAGALGTVIVWQYRSI
jgi:hypothetical protein